MVPAHFSGQTSELGGTAEGIDHPGRELTILESRKQSKERAFLIGE